MTPEAHKIRNRLEGAKIELALANRAVSNLEALCHHTWGPVLSDPIIRKGYTEPGDPPGTMGIDWRPAFYVPEKVTPRWTRTCSLCGKLEETQEVTQQVSSIPRF